VPIESRANSQFFSDAKILPGTESYSLEALLSKKQKTINISLKIND
jgi:hypothetical protein